MDMLEHNQKTCEHRTGCMENNASYHLYFIDTKQKNSCQMENIGTKFGQTSINILSSIGMQLCSCVLLSHQQSERKAQNNEGQGKVPGTSQRSCKCLMLTQDTPAGWKLCSTCCYCGLGIVELYEPALQRMWGGVRACEGQLNGFVMTLCMFTPDARDQLIQNPWEVIRKLSFQPGQNFSLMQLTCCSSWQ